VYVCVCSVSKYLAQNGLKHKSLGFDYQGVEMIQVMREDLMSVCAAIYTDGWNYLRNQCGYDSEPGGDLVSVYHIAKMDPETNDSTPPPEEVSAYTYTLTAGLFSAFAFGSLMYVCRHRLGLVTNRPSPVADVGGGR
jgi:hypothetical protein